MPFLHPSGNLGGMVRRVQSGTSNRAKGLRSLRQATRRENKTERDQNEQQACSQGLDRLGGRHSRISDYAKKPATAMRRR